MLYEVYFVKTERFKVVTEAKSEEEAKSKAKYLIDDLPSLYKTDTEEEYFAYEVD